MTRIGTATLIVLASVLATGCQSDSTPIADPVPVRPPAVLSANDLLGVTAESPVLYDATKGGTVFSDPSGRGLSYSLTLAGPADGLSVVGGSIAGVPITPGVVAATLTATDSRGNTAVDRFAIVIFAAGLQLPKLPATSLRYSDAGVPLPVNFTTLVNGTNVASADNTPATNPITDAGATLGRVLFYDPRLSAKDLTPCSGCHIQSLGFSDALKFSVGFAGGLTGRHSPGLANARFYQSGRFFWDERAATLEEQVLGPIQNVVEMGMTLDTLVLKLRATPYYPALFTAAFGTPSITTDRVSRALAQYVRSFVSGNSRYDRALRGDAAAALTAQEQQGEQLFRAIGCAGCHTTVAQISDAAHNIGLDLLNADVGTGHGAVKVPSLRNIAARPPYMHDGRFSTLEQVIDFFDSGVQPNPDLDARLKAADGTPRRLALTSDQKSALVAFLRTLTDSSFLTDIRFSDPFAAVSSAPAPSPTPGPPPGPPPVGPPVNAAITIQGNAYHPASVTVGPGATIAYTNVDNRRHSAFFFSTSAIVSTPIFTSGTQTVKMPTAPGTYPFQCAVHGAAMSGTIIVK